jgi:DNA-binding CsgD family transcriptional regulator
LARALALAGDRYPQLRALALYALGHLAWDQQDLPACVAAAEQALMLFRQLNDADGIVHSLAILGGAVTDQGDVAGGRALLEEALALSPPDRKPRDWVLSLLGMIVDLQGNDELALALLNESITLARSWGDPSLATYQAPFLADLARRRGDVVRAAALLHEAFAAYADLQAQAELAYCLEGTATLAATMEEWERAARLLGGAEALREQIGRPLDYPLRPNYDRLVATVRTALVDPPGIAAWAAGRALPLAVAVAEATAFLDRIATGSDPRPIAAGPLAMVEPAPSTLLAAAPTTIGADLTFREQEVLALLAQRLTDPEIAARLFLSPRTASKHVGNILGKLGAANRREAAAIAVRAGLV